MRTRSAAVVLACAAALIGPASAFGGPASGTPGQISWVRRAATNFVTAELAGNGASACAILNAPLRATSRHRTCAQRWNSRLSKLLHEPGARTQLRGERHAIATATVAVHGDVASIDLPAPLMSGPNRFVWSENCWMLEG
jgi:hypothetical protein